MNRRGQHLAFRILLFLASFILYNLIDSIPVIAEVSHKILQPWQLELLALSSIFALLLFYLWSVKVASLCRHGPMDNTWQSRKLPVDKQWVLILLVMVVIFGLYSNLEGWIYGQMGRSTTTNQAYLEEALQATPFLGWWYVDTIIVAPVLEELIFRKIWMTLFFQKDTRQDHILACLISGVIFGLMHVDYIGLEFVLYSLSGILFAVFYRLSGDIRLPIMVHIMNNFLASLTV
ncbi:hypothetical protein CL176_09215 [Suicoccus acidiformans]|uniref:CAAX prenyl protease 2/Lysostaphin resistance protein A-like domain-containing protein n=1 Tax=Suicoccus acidiformans TaxID=2036206 RepID=A0A347WM57_9LACT|nr:type II CAAX endopeptidase family protein [Suicoccus acidiformans]AXY26164.1 hypothetical protein CL176_09215 [Suicoccus acidiformans]